MTSAGGGMAVFNATTGMVLQTTAVSTDVAQLTPPALSLLQNGGQTYLATLGLREPGLPAMPLHPNGALGDSTILTAQGQDLGLITGITAAQFGEALHHFASMRTPGLLRLDAQGAAQFAADPLNLTGHGTRHAVTDIATVTVGGRDHIVTSHATANSVSVYRLTDGGNLEHRSDYGAEQDLGINAPMAIQPLQFGDKAFIIVASTLSSSLTVLRVGIDGVLSPVDHVVDDLNTRFFRVNALETVAVNDRHFVLAGGGDDGVSLFLILPNGRLVHLDSMADTLEATLARVSNLAATQVGDALHVFATSEREPGVTRLTVDVANTGQTLIASEGGSRVTGGRQDDILIGSDGNDTLIGGAGNDIIVDSPGRDQMTGGPGADLFVLAADGGSDVITDFEPGEDRLDLSAWVGLTSDSQLQIESRSWGAELRFQSEVLELRSASGNSLSRSDVLWAPVLNVTRFPLSSLPPATIDTPGEIPAGQAVNRTGTTGNDVLRGGAGNDTLNGAAGHDLLFGGDGDD
ncbi:MAG: M10 family metallopeptidase C-terminal domain-containing protein, partial [Rhodobacterales bacterium]